MSERARVPEKRTSLVPRQRGQHFRREIDRPLGHILILSGLIPPRQELLSHVVENASRPAEHVCSMIQLFVQSLAFRFRCVALMFVVAQPCDEPRCKVDRDETQSKQAKGQIKMSARCE